jgi:mRNA-degrading endonuclease toxin of MazEF toxin-antitoxin module
MICSPATRNVTVGDRYYVRLARPTIVLSKSVGDKGKATIVVPMISNKVDRVRSEAEDRMLAG